MSLSPTTREVVFFRNEASETAKDVQKEKKKEAKLYKTVCKKVEAASTGNNLFKKMSHHKLRTKMENSFKGTRGKENRIKNNMLLPTISEDVENGALCFNFSKLNLSSDSKPN